MFISTTAAARLILDYATQAIKKTSPAEDKGINETQLVVEDILTLFNLTCLCTADSILPVYAITHMFFRAFTPSAGMCTQQLASFLNS